MHGTAKPLDAFDLLRRDILGGVFPPGQPLRLAALSARYGLSATPLREALSRLEEKALVQAEPNKGWRTAPVSLAEFRDLQLARLSLESSLLEDAISQGGLDWESGIVAAHHHLKRTPMPLEMNDNLENRQAWIRSHDAFHAALFSAARSDWLKAFHRQASEQLQRHHQAMLFHNSFGAPDRRDALLKTALSVPRHTSLMDAVLSRDVAAALAELRSHVETTLSLYSTAISAPTQNTPE
jgi:GntR family transcriptional regulator, carbon starvation induced regulator